VVCSKTGVKGTEAGRKGFSRMPDRTYREETSGQVRECYRWGPQMDEKKDAPQKRGGGERGGVGQ